MKNWWLIVVMLLAFTSFAVAQTATIEDFKVVLITAIQSYFSNSPVVTVEELKDLLYAYFGTNTNTVDLSKTGSFSGQKLETIYYKVKGKPCTPSCVGKCGGESNGCSGTCDEPCGQCIAKVNNLIGGQWQEIDTPFPCKPKPCGNYDNCFGHQPSKIVTNCAAGYCCWSECKDVLNFHEIMKTAVKLDQPAGSTGYYGFFKDCALGSGNLRYSTPIGQTTWFLLDPKGFGVSGKNIHFVFIDCMQGGNFVVTMYTVDSNNNIMNDPYNPMRISLSNNQGGTYFGKQTGDMRYLIKVKNDESLSHMTNLYGQTSTEYNIYLIPSS